MIPTRDFRLWVPSIEFIIYFLKEILYKIFHSGSLIEETASDVILGLPGDKKIALKQSDIVSRTPAVSSMPPVSAILKKHEIRDLIAYLTTLNEGTGK